MADVRQMTLHTLLANEQDGVLRLGGARMALLDIEASFWGLRRQMEALVGRQLTDTAMQQAGANGGASFARAFAPDVTEDVVDSAFRACVAAYQAAGFGRFEVEIREWPLGRVLVRGHDTFEAWMVRQHGEATSQPACAYTSGVLVGFINALTDRRDIVCIQRSCQAGDDECCVFELLPAAEADQTAVIAFDADPGFADQNGRTTATERAETNELATLLDISQNVASTLDLEPLLDRILRQLKDLVAYEGASILALEEDTLRVLAYRGPIPQEDVTRLRFLLSEARANQTVIRRREPVIIADVHADSPLAQAFQATAGPRLTGMFSYIRSWMGVPLIVRDQVIGMLSLDHGRPDVYAGRHSLLAQTVANKVAVAIENARFHEHAEEAAAVAERNRLARELHDAVSQTLFSASLIAEVLPRLWENNPVEGRRRLEELRELTRGALAEMRALLMELRPATLTEFSLADLLRQLTEATIGRSRLRVELVVKDELSLPPDVQVALYRIAQEALHNVAKHAGAERVRIDLRYEGDTVQLTIEDDGRGFDVDSIPPGSLGVGIMRERAAKIGAALHMNSRIGKGTTITVCWPSEESNDD